ncbi:SusC/RagA family TonB-linked outer membrane protein [Winogradskyella tangerina]|uniref:SusC/RagA family TonB-linked outer membrane protein n=1 Tax=Winogradskyella tangerina TaxID=2023240 RepID=UPI000DBE2D1E|nr:SusC/RagA family TonB-linked outer membrane protein [Winogradskyella tangerina]
MKTRFVRILTLLILFCAQIALAQEKLVTGTVSDETGSPLPGAAILQKGTTNGVSTNFEGIFSIEVSEGDILVFSYLGYGSKEILVRSANVINVSLEPDNALDEVVVTALGIKSKPRELTYASQTVTSEEIENTNEVNLTSSLAAKAAGVQVTTSSGSVGSSANIRIRGNTSINRSNSPLFVIDGVPIDNSSSQNGTGGVDNSNRAIDINQNDIASINILKGTAAQALYGLRASNGVILITTKSGKSGKTRITLSSSIAVSEVTNLPALQKQYAQGRPVGGALTWRGPETGEGFSWGPAISNLEFDGATDYPYDSNGRLVPTGMGNGLAARSYDNYSFFVNGIATDLNVSASGGTEEVKYFISTGKNDQSGTSPTEQFSRISFRANISADITDRLNVLASGTFVNSGGRRVQRGSNISGIMLGLLRTSPTFDNGNGLSGREAAATESVYQLPNGTQRSYRGGIYDNPYWTVAKNPSFDDVNRFIGGLQFNYQFNGWLTLNGKYGYDRYSDVRKLGIDINSATDRNGVVTDRTEINEDINTQLLLLFNKDISDKVNVGGTLGYDQYKTNRLIRRVDGFGLTIPGFFHVSNSATQVNDEFVVRRELRGLYAQAKIGYDNMLFANLAYRKDWSSTLPINNNSFDSYGLGASFVFSELLKDNSILNFGKFRISGGKSGNDAPAYSTITYYQSGSAGGDGFISNNEFPLFGQVAFERSSLLGNPNIKPEKTTEYEVGLDLKFLDSRINLDVTYYNKETTDQIINVTQAATTGFTNRVINAGVISNNGWEVTLNTVPVRTTDFNWDLGFNFTQYESVVEELVEGIEPIILNGFTSTSSRAVPGESYGAIWGSRWLRDENGNQLVDNNGVALADPTSGVIGDPIPDFTLGIRNSFEYKSLRLTAVLDIRKGGDVWCGTCGILDYFGVSAKTGQLRDQSYVVDGIVQSTGAQNTTAVPYADPAGGLGANRWVRYGFGGIAEDNIYDGSYAKLRELSLTYSLGDKILNQIGFTSASITLSGRNLFLITDYPGIDPETNLTGDSNGIGLDYFNQPFTRSYALAIKLTF